ncbi:DUF4358 domain-containing protein [Fusibacter bizertensis]
MNTKLKKATLKFILILIIAILSGCSNSKTPIEAKGSAIEIAASVAESQSDMPKLSVLQPEDDYFSGYLDIYGLDESLFSDAAICYADGAQASEITVFLLNASEDVDDVETALQEYREKRIDSFRGYVLDQEALAEKGFVVKNGLYVALIIAPAPETARDAFLNAFSDKWAAPDVASIFKMPNTTSAGSTTTEALTTTQEKTDSAQLTDESLEASSKELETSEQEQTKIDATTDTSETVSDETETTVEDPYDAASILAVWQGGNVDTLTDKNRAIYDAAVSAINQVITNDMSDYKKELAIHDYILSVCTYDTEANSNAPDAKPNPDNDNPYGTLIEGVSICWGYTNTFQLFMDMLDITCISIGGSSRSLPHAWNMVQLDDQWYCVDVTWDDSSPNHYRYFNVTSQFMRDTTHQWDETDIPVAKAPTK